jgi:hypothetical protein
MKINFYGDFLFLEWKIFPLSEGRKCFAWVSEFVDFWGCFDGVIWWDELELG